LLKDKQHIITAYFETYGIPVQTSFIRGGLSVYTKTRKTPIARFVPAGKGGSVEVMWYSHRDKWDHIGDFGGMTMPLEEALKYVVSDAPSCFGIDYLIWERNRI
jgi:hypothetical protein